MSRSGKLFSSCGDISSANGLAGANNNINAKASFSGMDFI